MSATADPNPTPSDSVGPAVSSRDLPSAATTGAAADGSQPRQQNPVIAGDNFSRPPSVLVSRLLVKWWFSYFLVALLPLLVTMGWIYQTGRNGAPLWPALLFAVPFAALISAAALYYPRRDILEPVRALTRQAQAIAAGHFHSGPPLAHGNDEVGALTEAIETMANRLETSFREVTEKSSQLEGILRSLLNGVIAINQRHQILLFNPVAERYFSISAQEAAGKQLVEVTRHFELVTLCEEVLASAVPKSREITIVLGSQERILQTEAAPLRSRSGQVVGVVVIFHDITELRRLERVRKDFVANVSHELRTPLTSVKGFVETLLDGAIDDPAVSHRFLEIIRQQTDQLVALVNDLLDLSRVESPDIPLRYQPVDLNTLIKEVHETLGPRARDQSLRFEMDLDPALPLLRGDEDLLRRLLLNLADNAIKYTPAGGRVTIRTRQLPSGQLELAVADTGVGIPKRDLPRIFERFYRVDKARSRELGGTGLGLSIVKHIVERHGATITVDSEVGEGTTFTVHFPASLRLSLSPGQSVPPQAGGAHRFA